MNSSPRWLDESKMILPTVQRRVGCQNTTENVLVFIDHWEQGLMARKVVGQLTGKREILKSWTVVLYSIERLINQIIYLDTPINDIIHLD